MRASGTVEYNVCSRTSTCEFSTPSLARAEGYLYSKAPRQKLRPGTKEKCLTIWSATELAATISRPFDVVCSDFQMPTMNGVELLRVISLLEQQPSCILITGYLEVLRGSYAKAPHLVEILIKPFDPEQLIGLVGRLGRVTRLRRSIDSHKQAELTVIVLRAVGMRAEAVRDGESAIRVVREAGVDVCVLDLIMPGMDGVQTYEEIRRLDGSSAVIAVSGRSVPEMMHRLMSLSGYACLRKPFDMRELVRAIARARGESMKG